MPPPQALENVASHPAEPAAPAIENLGSHPAEPAAPAIAVSDYELGRDVAPASGTASFAPIRPDRLTVWPSDDGSFGIAVRWQGRQCILRAVVVRRLLTEAGFPATAGNSIDGRTWEVTVSRVPADQVSKIIETYIW